MNMIEPGFYGTAYTSAQETVHKPSHKPAGASPARAAASDRSIGAILVDAGRLSIADAERVLHQQKTQGRRFGEAAMELGLIGSDDLRFALAHQFDYAYLPADDTSLSRELVAAYAPFSPVVEQLRALRSQLMLRWFDSKASAAGLGNVLAVVSPGAGEGRSFIAANLAVVFSQLGERTLLIDADLRAPRQHELFKLGRHAGLSGLLAGRANSETIVRVPTLLELSLLPAGAVPPNPQELLGRPVFGEALRSLSQDFDVVIVDTPAASEYADAQTIAARAGASLMVARKNQSSLRDTVAFAHHLQQSGAYLVGSVLNDA